MARAVSVLFFLTVPTLLFPVVVFGGDQLRANLDRSIYAEGVDVPPSLLERMREGRLNKLYVLIPVLLGLMRGGTLIPYVLDLSGWRHPRQRHDIRDYPLSYPLVCLRRWTLWVVPMAVGYIAGSYLPGKPEWWFAPLIGLAVGIVLFKRTLDDWPLRPSKLPPLWPWGDPHFTYHPHEPTPPGGHILGVSLLLVVLPAALAALAYLALDFLKLIPDPKPLNAALVVLAFGILVGLVRYWDVFVWPGPKLGYDHDFVNWKSFALWSVTNFLVRGGCVILAYFVCRIVTEEADPAPGWAIAIRTVPLVLFVHMFISYSLHGVFVSHYPEQEDTPGRPGAAPGASAYKTKDTTAPGEASDSTPSRPDKPPETQPFE